MKCRIEDLRNKQVVCMVTGNVIGFVGDIEFDAKSGEVLSIIITGKPRAFGLFGKYQDIIVPWREIEVIGEETVLIKNSFGLCQTI